MAKKQARLGRKQVAEALQHLSSSDARLGTIIGSVGKWSMQMQKDPFQSLVEAIIYQQLAGSAADAIYARFLKIYGNKFPAPANLLATKDSKLRAAGLSSRKAEYIRDLALHVQDGRLKLDLLPSMADEDVIEQLVSVKGIGRWTAEMFLIFCLGRPDILPVGDLGLRRAMQRAYGLPDLPEPAAMRDIAKCWKPYCSVATWYMWKSLEKFKGIG